MEDDEEESKNDADSIENDNDNFSRRKVKVTTLKIIDEVTDYGNGKSGKSFKNNGTSNNIPSRKSYMKVTTHTVDVQTFSSESVHSTPKEEEEEDKRRMSLKVINMEGAGNLKRNSKEEKSQPSNFRKESISKNPEPRGSSFKRTSIGKGASNKVSSIAIEEEKPIDKGPRRSQLASGTMALAGDVIRKLSKGFSSSSAFFKRDKKSEFKMNYLVLYKDYKQEKPKYAYYLVIDLIRHILLASVLVFLFRHPYAQIIIITLLNSSMMLYLLLVRPFSRIKDVIQNTVNELMVSICCCSCTYLAYLDRIGDIDLNRRMYAGWSFIMLI